MDEPDVFMLMDEARDLRDRIAWMVEGPVADPVDIPDLQKLVRRLNETQNAIAARS